jgi:hypothetical protein
MDPVLEAAAASSLVRDLHDVDPYTPTSEHSKSPGRMIEFVPALAEADHRLCAGMGSNSRQRIRISERLAALQPG